MQFICADKSCFFGSTMTKVSTQENLHNSW